MVSQTGSTFKINKLDPISTPKSITFYEFKQSANKALGEMKVVVIGNREIIDAYAWFLCAGILWLYTELLIPDGTSSHFDGFILKAQCTESIQAHLPLMFPHFLHLVHLSNPDELYDLHLKSKHIQDSFMCGHCEQ